MPASLSPTPTRSCTLSAQDAIEIGATPLTKDPRPREWDWFVLGSWIGALTFCAVAWIALVLIIAGVLP